MFLRRILQTLGRKRLQGADDPEAGVARFDHVVDVTVETLGKIAVAFGLSFEELIKS